MAGRIPRPGRFAARVNRRLKALDREAAELQAKLAAHGYPPGEPINSPHHMPDACRGWLGRLWQIGFEKTSTTRELRVATH